MSDDSKIAPMSQYPQVARELGRALFVTVGDVPLISAQEYRDILREKFDLPLSKNDDHFRSPVNLDLSQVASGELLGDGIEEEYEDEYGAAEGS